MNETREEPWNGEEEARTGASADKATGRLVKDLAARWYWIGFGIILGVAAGAYYLSKARPEYSANATLLVKQATTSVLTKDQNDEIDMRSVEAMNTVAERLKRQSLLERVAARADVVSLEGLNPKPVRWLPGWMSGASEDEVAVGGMLPPTPLLAARFASWMRVSVRRGTRLVDVSISHPSPVAAAVLADAIAMEYIEEMSEQKSSGRTNSIEVLTNESEKARFSLQASQNAFTSYVRAMESHSQLEVKEKELEDLGRRYLPKHPKMITCKGQVETLQARFLADFDAAVKSGADQAYWKQSGIELSADSQSIDERLDIARRVLLARTAVLKSEIQSQELVFNAILTKMRETDVNQASSDAEVEVSSRALVPGVPVSPVRAKVMAAGLFGGAVFGVMIAYLSIRADNKFNTVMELEERSGLPVIGAVSQVPFDELADLIEGGRAEAPAHEKDWSGNVLFRKALYTTTYAEMIRVVRASVTLLGPEGGRKVTMFSSSISGEGKSFMAVNFALAAAAQGKRVLLMDFDLRKPSVHKYFGIQLDSESIGTSGCLAGLGSIQEAMVPGGVAPNLDVLVGGLRLPHPGELLNERSLVEMLDEAKARYDVIVLDTSPLLAVPDARILARFADNVCLVVRAAYVPKDAVERSISLIGGGRGRISGLILNGYRESRGLIAANHAYGYYQYGPKGPGGRRGYGAYGSYGGGGA